MDPRSRQQGTPLAYRLRRMLHRRRRLIACLLFCAAAGIAVESLVGDSTTTAVVSASRDLAVGTVLTESDLSVVELPVEVVADHGFDHPGEVVGQQLAVPLPKGFPLPPTAVVGEGLLTGTAPGTVAVPLRPADPSTVRILAPGQLVDVILRTGNGYDVAADSTVLARSAPVLWIAPAGAGTGGMWSGGGDESGLVVVAAGPEDAASLAGASSSGDVHLILTSGQ
jgi:pilus assembly protein CpaB